MFHQFKIPAVGLLMAVTMTSALAQNASKTLGVAAEIQKHSNWCWAATSKTIIKFIKGNAPQQCEIVNWLRGTNYACNGPTFDWTDPVNTAAFVWGNGSVQDLLWNWDIDSTDTSGLTFTGVKNQINANKPFVIRIGFKCGESDLTKCPGHFMAGIGYRQSGSNKYVTVMDPWPDEGINEKYYSYLVNNNNYGWTTTLYNLTPR